MQTLISSSLVSNADRHEINSISTQFNKHFKLIVANTAKLQEEVYRIRYKVYCQELGYEREENCLNGMERDIYDRHSIHCLLLHRSSRLYAGCVRLVLPQRSSKEAAFPFEKVFGSSWHSDFNEKDFSYLSFGEVSRLAVTAEFRKRSGENQTSYGVSEQESDAQNQERRYFPLIALGLYLAATGVALEVGLEHAFSLMEPRLARHLRRYGIQFNQIGKLVEFRGQRGLFEISRSAVLSGMDTDTLKLFQSLRSDVKQSLIHWTPSLLYGQAS